ncbi:MAG: hypothetical protein H0T45_04985, partial [Pyrinomonadaceae bacterium]|nr:hypothetical protein [Pyrinomonadaceae bacterium]
MSKKLRQLICVVVAAGACGALSIGPATTSTNASADNHRWVATSDNAPATIPPQQQPAKPPQQAPEAETKEAMKVQ